MKKLMTVMIICIIGTSVSLFAGCNTVKGVGQDVSQGGRDIQRAAN